MITMLAMEALVVTVREYSESNVKLLILLMVVSIRDVFVNRVYRNPLGSDI